MRKIFSAFFCFFHFSFLVFSYSIFFLLFFLIYFVFRNNVAQNQCGWIENSSCWDLKPYENTFFLSLSRSRFAVLFMVCTRTYVVPPRFSSLFSAYIVLYIYNYTYVSIFSFLVYLYISYFSSFFFIRFTEETWTLFYQYLPPLSCPFENWTSYFIPIMCIYMHNVYELTICFLFFFIHLNFFISIYLFIYLYFLYFSLIKEFCMKR